MLLQSDKWGDAIKSFKKSPAKGKLKNESKVHFALGLAHYNKKDLSSALDPIKKAKFSSKRTNSPLETQNNNSIDKWF